MIFNPEEAKKLLDNGYRIVIFKDGLGDYTAIAVRPDDSLQKAVKRWHNYDAWDAGDVEEGDPQGCAKSVFTGPNRYAGGGRTVAQALHCLTEKVLFKRLPQEPEENDEEAE